MTTLFGIKNCDTAKKACKWLEARGVDYRFHDFRADGLDAGHLDGWLAVAGWELLLNRRGTSWRKLDATVREAVDAASARELMLENPTLIKRPVLEHGGRLLVGFDEADYSALFGT